MMNWYEIQDYISAYQQEENEKLVMLMNCMAVAYGGTAKDRRKMAAILLGSTTEAFNVDEFESAMVSQFLATPVETEEQQEAKEWALAEFDANDPAFKVKKNG
jgi:hypothetical protein